MEYGIGQNPKWATVFKDKISNIKNTKISSGLKMAVSVGCMWGGNACGHGTTMPTGQLLLAKDLPFGGFSITQDWPHYSCWRSWQAGMWVLESCIGLRTTSVQMDLFSLPSLNLRLKKRELVVLSWVRWMIFVVKLRTFLYYTVKVQLPQRRQGKRRHVICFIALG